jgi:hypothetical protein
MSDEIKKVADADLDEITGGYTASLRAAYGCIAGVYGNGQTRVNNLLALGLDPIVVQGLVNSILAGHVAVANDVINGKYGNGQARVVALTAAGYNAQEIQNLVNHMVLS